MTFSRRDRQDSPRARAATPCELTRFSIAYVPAVELHHRHHVGSSAGLKQLPHAWNLIDGDRSLVERDAGQNMAVAGMSAHDYAVAYERRFEGSLFPKRVVCFPTFSPLSRRTMERAKTNFFCVVDGRLVVASSAMVA